MSCVISDMTNEAQKGGLNVLSLFNRLMLGNLADVNKKNLPFPTLVLLLRQDSQASRRYQAYHSLLIAQTMSDWRILYTLYSN